MNNSRQISGALAANISLGCGCCGCDSSGNGILPFLESDSATSAGSLTYTPETNTDITQLDDVTASQDQGLESTGLLSDAQIVSNLNPTFEPGDTGIYGREFYTNEQIADQLNYGYWGGTARAFDVSSDNIITVNLNNLDENGANTARQALKTWSDLADIEFVEVAGTATAANIQFDDEDSGAYNSSRGYYGPEMITLTESNINVDTAWTAYGTYYLQTFIHEIGHALGLGHAGNYNGSANVSNDALYANDSWQASIMSYFSQGQNGNIDASTVRLLTPSVADIIAIQRLYGADEGTRAGDTIYGNGADESYLSFDTSLGVTLYDAGGVDTIDLTHKNTSQGIDLQDGTFSNINGRIGNVGIAEGTIIENVITGSGADVIYGNSVDNLIQTSAGNDQIYASAGSDILDGGANTDTLFYDGLFDTFSFAFTSAADFIVTSLSDTFESIDTVLNVEWLQFSDILTSTTELFDASNNAPTAFDDSFDASENQNVTGNVLLDNGNGADIDVDGNPLSVVAGTFITAQGASVVVSSNGDFVYTPILGVSGDDSFDYTVEDGNGGSDIGTVSIKSLPGFSEGLSASYYTLGFAPSMLSDIDFTAAADYEETVTSIDQSGYYAFYDGGPTDQFAAKYEGYINVAEAGTYTLSLNSDDGSALWLNNALIIDNDGGHAATKIKHTLYLDAGLHALDLQYFEGAGGQTLELSWSGPDTGGVEAIIAGDALQQSQSIPDIIVPDAPEVPDISEVAAGLFASYYALGFAPSMLSDIDFTAAADYEEIVTSIDQSGYAAFYNGGPTDQFAAKYEGYINVAEAGTYTLSLNSDDGSALWLNNALIIDNDGGHAATKIEHTLYLDAGLHALDLQYFEGAGGQTLELSWSGPDTGGVEAIIAGDALQQSQSIPEIIVPDVPEVPDISEVASGLFASYYALGFAPSMLSDIDFTAAADYEETVTSIDQSGYYAFYDGGPTDQFAAKYEGYINVAEAGTYTLSLNSDDGSALWLNNALIIDNDGGHAATKIEHTLYLDAGLHALELQYFEGAGGQTLELSWSGPDTGGIEAIIAGDALQYGLNVITGTAIDDVLYGTDLDDLVLGLEGNDQLISSAGSDVLDGGEGSDTYLYEALTAFDGVDTIRSFNQTEDSIDISDVLSGYDPLSDAIADFVQITDDGTDSFIALDVDGGADDFAQIARIEGVTGINDVAALELSGVLMTENI